MHSLADGSNISACSVGRLDDINKNCLEQFRKHWQCLDNNNQQLWHCRRPEQLLNACVYDNLVRARPPSLFLSLARPCIHTNYANHNSHTRNSRRRYRERPKMRLLYTCAKGRYSHIMPRVFAGRSRSHGVVFHECVCWSLCRRGLVSAMQMK